MGTDARKKYHRESLNTTDTVLANEKMRRVELGQPVVPKFDLTIADAWEKYKAILVGRSVKQSSIDTIYNITMKSLLAYAEGRKPPVTRLADIDINFLDQWIGTGKVKPSTRANQHSTIRGLFATAAGRKWIPEDPTLLLKPPKGVNQGGKTQPFDLDTEDGKILAALPHWESTLQRPRQTYKSPWARNPRTAAALVLVLRHTGLRINDATRFDPSSLKRTTIEGQKVYLHYAPHQRKTDAPVFVPIVAEIAEQIINAPRMCEEYAFWDGKTEERLWCRAFIPNCLSYISRVSGVAHIHPHRFRDTFAVDLLSHGADIRSVSRLLGHKNVATTLRYYEHYIPADQKKLIDVVLKHHTDKAKVIPFAKNA
jgi:site-specific recombinase XerD